MPSFSHGPLNQEQTHACRWNGSRSQPALLKLWSWKWTSCHPHIHVEPQDFLSLSARWLLSKPPGRRGSAWLPGVLSAQTFAFPSSTERRDYVVHRVPLPDAPVQPDQSDPIDPIFTTCHNSPKHVTFGSSVDSFPIPRCMHACTRLNASLVIRLVSSTPSRKENPNPNAAFEAHAFYPSFVRTLNSQSTPITTPPPPPSACYNPPSWTSTPRSISTQG